MLIKELLAMQKPVNESEEKKFVIIKVYYDYLYGGESSEDHDEEEDGDERTPENGYINIKCESEDQARRLVEALGKSKDWYFGAAMLVAEEQIDSEEQQTVEVQDGQDPDVELANQSNGRDIDIDANDFIDEVGVEI